MSTSGAFTSMGKTIALTAAVSPPTPVQIVSLTLGASNLEIINTAVTPVFIGYGIDAATATANAVIPVPGTPQFCVVVLGGSDKVISVPPNFFVTAAIASGTGTVYFTPGDGV